VVGPNRTGAVRKRLVTCVITRLCIRRNVEWSKSLKAVVLALPTVILALLPLVVPELTVWLLGGAVAFLVVGVIALQQVKIRELSKENVELREANTGQGPRFVTPKFFQTLGSVSLYLEGWKATEPHRLRKGDRIKVSVSGDHRFKAHLAHTPRAKAKRFESLKSSAETKDWRGLWEIDADGEYVIVVEPSGDSPFWVRVDVELEEK